MITFTYPWLVILVFLPILFRFVPTYFTQSKAIRYNRFFQLLALTRKKPSTGAVQITSRIWQRVCISLAYLALVIAACKPVYYGEPMVVEERGREFMVAIDLSGSMETQDFFDEWGREQRRIDVVKDVLQDFLAQRAGDRVGLIAFGDEAYLQSPFTHDFNLLNQLLQEMDVRMAGSGTAIGDAIGIAVNHFKSTKDKATTRQVLLLLTDGRDTSSKFSPIDAARYAAEQGITIYPVAIGDPESIGEDAMDIDLLNDFSELTGGQTFEVMNAFDMVEMYQKIEELEPQLFSSYTVRPQIELYYWPIGLVLLFTLATLLILSSARRIKLIKEAR